ncbi:MAG TPA: transcription antitermination factor NusB [Bacillota bacterium]|nr:transcription antitermination factor NusB [Bacillota bacterium]
MSRRLAREVAFRALFQVDVGNSLPRLAVNYAAEGYSFSPEQMQFINELVHGTIEHKQAIDEIIKKHLVKWELKRISAVDRNLLRLALFEILHRSDIPAAVSINEALELAKKYGSTPEAVAFINGLLDRVVGEALGRES